ncbi:MULTISPECIES: hypothetical protein [unclassified Shewanella]|uniref:hypothetical protein n=1 Tax=unclassified Shewanella TaxID=196818 RepID=UPI000C828CCF|nr:MULTISPECIES: hypothetical protein [unclassified Shewanella]MDO6639250.1 hypothetical protein [Shewanella sp. 5_MG-2023]MDO6677502.1 hypothetical protein [Shewanella sp. 4_MG-2023]MDO6774918.1 hypothetical protein [Shewanella sp. 3_MG-2023]PMG29410.1 hypothetical protein BCU94_13655 [Shewanella sp. 10N.286.52.C2]PMG41279.1 hypothetical protein BCU91_10745 [Shewanella sp. 10N.286.52.B9]
MVSSKDFANWLMIQFEQLENGVSLTRGDINQLTGRQNFSLVFVHDIHYELMQHGIAFVTDTYRERFYMVRVQDNPWRKQLEDAGHQQTYSNIVSINMTR